MSAAAVRWGPALLATIAGLLLLVACTGTQEGGRPVLLVVATPEHVGLVEDPGPAAEALRWLEAARRPLPPGTTVVDLAIARAAGPDDTAVHAHVLTRESGADTLRIFDATAVPVEAPEAFVQIEELALEPLAGDLLTEDLCSTGFDVSRDGRWLALVHEPSACGLAPADRTIVLLDLDPDPDDDADVSWTLQAGENVAPTFAPDGDTLYFFDDTFEGRVAFVPIPYDGEAESEVPVPLDVDAFSGLGIGGGGRLVVADADAIVSFDPDDAEDAVRQESASGLVDVIDAELLPGSVAVVRTGGRLVVHRDVLSEEADADVAETPLFGLDDAVVGPDAFVYALADGSLSVVDVLSYLSDAERDPTVVTRTELPELAAAVAVDWVYGAFPEAAPGAP